MATMQYNFKKITTVRDRARVPRPLPSEAAPRIRSCRCKQNRKQRKIRRFGCVSSWPQAPAAAAARLGPSRALGEPARQREPSIRPV